MSTENNGNILNDAVEQVNTDETSIRPSEGTANQNNQQSTTANTVATGADLQAPQVSADSQPAESSSEDNQGRDENSNSQGQQNQSPNTANEQSNSAQSSPVGNGENQEETNNPNSSQNNDVQDVGGAEPSQQGLDNGRQSNQQNEPQNQESENAPSANGREQNNSDEITDNHSFDVNVAGPTRSDELENSDSIEDEFSFDVDITAVNDAVVIDTNSIPAFNTDEDNLIHITEAALLANASDVDGDDLTVTNLSIDNATFTTVIDPETGDRTFIVTPDENVNGDLAINFNVTDSQGSTVVSGAELVVEAVNDAPVLAETIFTINEDNSIIITPADLLPNISDVDGDTVTVTDINANDHGSVTQNTDGNWVFTPDENYAGDATLTISLSDGTATTEHNATVSITPDADAPSLTVSPAETVLIDSESAPSITTGWLTDNANGYIETHPDHVYTGINEGRGNVIELEANRGDESNIYQDLNVSAGDTVTLSFDLSARKNYEGEDSQVNVYFDGELVDVIIPEQVGWNTFTYQLTATTDNPRLEFNAPGDNSLGAVLDQINVVETEIFAEDTAVSLDINAALTDTDGSEEIDSIVLDAVMVGATITDGTNEFVASEGNDSVDVKDWDLSTLTFQGPQDFVGDVSLDVTVTAVETANGDSAQTTETIEFNVFNVNDPVVIDENSTPAFNTDEDSVIHITEAALLANASDVDGDDLTVTNLSIDNATFTTVIDPETGDRTFIVTPDENVNGDLAINFNVTDSQGSTVVSGAELVVEAVNDAPVLAETIFTINEDNSIIITPADLLPNISDVDGDTVTVTDINANDHGSVTQNTDGNWVFTPDENYAGDATLTISLSDGTATTEHNATVSITPDADAPSLTVSPAETVLIDSESAPSITTGWLTDNANGYIETHPDHVYTGINEGRGNVIELEANRGDESNIYQDLNVSAGDTVTLSFDLSARKNYEGEDSQVNVYFDGELVDVIIPEQVGWNTFTYQLTATTDNPRLEFNAPGDNSLGAVLDQINVVETEIFAEDTAVSLDINAALTDTDGSEEIDSIVLDAVMVGATITDGTNEFVASEGNDSVDVKDWDLSTLTFQGPQDFVGDVSLDVTVTAIETANGDSAQTTETIEFNVFNVNDPVVIDENSTPAFNTDEDSVIHITEAALLANASDVDGDDLTVTNLSIDNATFTTVIDPETGDRTFIVTPDENVNGDLAINFNVTDSQGSTVVSGAELVVEAVNDAPVLAETIFTINEDNSIIITPADLLPNISDVDGDTVTVTDISANDHGSVTQNTDGNWVFTPDENYAGDATLTISLSDGTATTEHNATVSITPDADAPSLTVSPAETVLIDSESAPSITTGWLTDNANGYIETHPDHVYTGINEGRGNVIELEANRGDESNIYQDLNVSAGDTVTLSFDLSARKNYEGEDSQVNVYFDGELVDVIIPEQVGWNTFTYQLTATTDNPRLEFNAPGDNSLGAVLDQINVVETEIFAEDTAVSLDINAALTDTDGSEEIDSIVLDAVMVGATITDGTNEFVASEGNDSVDVKDWDLSTLTFQGPQDFVGDVSLDVTVTAVETANGDSAQTTETIEFNVFNVNDPVVIDENSTPAFNTDEDSVIHITEAALLANASDVDGDDLTVTNLSIDNATFTTVIDPETGDRTFIVTPDENVNGDLAINFNVTDSQGSTVVSGAELVVEAVNDPVIANDDDTISSQPAMIRMDEEPDFGSLQYQNEAGEWADMVTGQEYDADTDLQFMPDENMVLAATRDIRIGSFDNDTSTHVFDGTAETSDWGEVRDNAAVYTDGDLTITTQVSSGDLTAWNGAGTSVGAGIGNDSRHGLSNEETLTVTIEGEDVNQITFQLDGLGGYFDSTNSHATEVIITAYDKEGNEIDSQGDFRESGNYQDTYSFSTTQPVHHFELGTTGGNGTYVVQNMTVSRVANEELQLTTIQGDGSETSNALSLVLDHDNAANPSDVTEALIDIDTTITTSLINVDEDGELIISAQDLLQNDTDADGDILTISAVTATEDTHGTVSLNEDGDIVFTPETDYNGPASFTYTAIDGNGSSDTATVSVNVIPVNDAPVAPTLSVSGVEDQTLTIDPAYILDKVSDIDSNNLTLENLVIRHPDNATLSLNQDGTYQVLVPENFNGLIDLNYAVSDGELTTEGSLNLNIMAVDDKPFQTGNAHLAAVEDGSVTFYGEDLIDLFSDVDSALTISRVITADGEEAEGNLLDNGDGSWTFTPTDDFAGTTGLVVIATDGTSEATLDMNVYVRPIADGVAISTDFEGPLVFSEDSSGFYSLNIEQLDTSEVITSVMMTGYPVGFTVGDGVNSIAITEEGQAVDISNWDMDSMSITPPSDFNGSFSVTVSVVSLDEVESPSLYDVTEELGSQPSENTPFIVDEDGSVLIIAAELLETLSDAETLDVSTVDYNGDDGTLIDNNNGTWTFWASPDYIGDIDIAFTTSDGQEHIQLISVPSDTDDEPEIQPSTVEPTVNDNNSDYTVAPGDSVNIMIDEDIVNNADIDSVLISGLPDGIEPQNGVELDGGDFVISGELSQPITLDIADEFSGEVTMTLSGIDSLDQPVDGATQEVIIDVDESYAMQGSSANNADPLAIENGGENADWTTADNSAFVVDPMDDHVAIEQDNEPTIDDDISGGLDI